MKNTKTFAFVTLLCFMFFSCSNVEEETPDLSDKDLVKVSIGSLSILQSAPVTGRTSAIPAAVEYIDVIYGPYPEVITNDPGQIWERVLKTFAVADFPDNYTIEVERDREYYIAIAAYSLTTPDYGSAYRIYFTVSGTQPVFMSDELNGILKNDFFAFSEIFTAEDDMSINAQLNRVSAQLAIQMPDGVNLPANATKGEIRITDACQDHLGGIYLDLLHVGDICDELTTTFTADLTTATGIDTVFHIMPMSDSGPISDIVPLEISVKLFDEFDAVIAEGSAQTDTIRHNTRYNFVLNPNAIDKSISIDVDETIGEEVDIVVE